MTNLHQGAEDYLELRRSFGFKLKRPCRFIREFVSWLQNRGETRTKGLGDCRCRQKRLTVIVTRRGEHQRLFLLEAAAHRLFG